GVSIGQWNIGPTQTGTERRMNSAEPTGIGVMSITSTTIATIATNSLTRRPSAFIGFRLNVLLPSRLAERMSFGGPFFLRVFSVSTNANEAAFLNEPNNQATIEANQRTGVQQSHNV